MRQLSTAEVLRMTYTNHSWHVDILSVGSLDFETDSEFFRWATVNNASEWSWVEAGDCFAIILNSGTPAYVWPHYANLGNGRYF